MWTQRGTYPLVLRHVLCLSASGPSSDLSGLVPDVRRVVLCCTAKVPSRLEISHTVTLVDRRGRLMVSCRDQIICVVSVKSIIIRWNLYIYLYFFLEV